MLEGADVRSSRIPREKFRHQFGGIDRYKQLHPVFQGYDTAYVLKCSLELWEDHEAEAVQQLVSKESPRLVLLTPKGQPDIRAWTFQEPRDKWMRHGIRLYLRRLEDLEQWMKLLEAKPVTTTPAPASDP